MTRNPNSYVFKVSLRHRKGTWRRIAFDGDLTLHDLHEAIFCAFDRDDEHLYSFSFATSATRGRRFAVEPKYSHPMAAAGAGPSGEGLGGNATQVSLDSLRLRQGQRFSYLFDFGDHWLHDIVVEAVNAGQRASSVGVIERRGASPPQYPAEE